MKIRNWLLVFAFAVLGSNLPASVSDYNSSPFDQHQETELAIRNHREAEGRLDKAFNQKLAGVHSDSERKNLVASQKAWIAYRDSVLLFETPANNDWGSGTEERLNTIGKQMIDERIHLLTQEL